MSTTRVIRICLLLAGIFAAGVVTGRLSAPKQTPVLITGTGHAQTPESLAAEFQRRIGLDDEQREECVPIFDRMIREMLPYEPLTDERRAIFKRTMENLRPLLRSDQIGAFERFTQEIENTARRSSEPGANR